MPLLGFDDLFREADARRSPVPVAVAGGAGRTVLEALRTATDRGWVTPIVVGDEAEIRQLANELRVDLSGFEILHAHSSALPAVATVRDGRAAMLMKGQISTPELMHAVLDPDRGLRDRRTIFQVVLMEVLRDRRRFLMADTGVLIRPKLSTRAEILEAVVELAQALGSEEPNVAVLAASEKCVDAMPETLDAAELQRRNEIGMITGCVVRGPLSFDLAYAADAADKKQIGGPVVGAADVMIFPNLLSANLTVKAIMYTADCRFGGVLLGTTHPVVFMSRADSAATRLHSLALALKLVP